MSLAVMGSPASKRPLILTPDSQDPSSECKPENYLLSLPTEISEVILSMINIRQVNRISLCSKASKSRVFQLVTDFADPFCWAATEPPSLAIALFVRHHEMINLTKLHLQIPLEIIFSLSKAFHRQKRLRSVSLYLRAQPDPPGRVVAVSTKFISLLPIFGDCIYSVKRLRIAADTGSTALRFDVVALAETARQLEYLGFFGCVVMSESSVEAIGSHCKNLCRVSLPSSVPSSCFRLLSPLKKLRRIDSSSSVLRDSIIYSGSRSDSERIRRWATSSIRELNALGVPGCGLNFFYVQPGKSSFRIHGSLLHSMIHLSQHLPLSIFETLLSSGRIDVNYGKFEHKSPLSLAVETRSSLDLVKLLIKYDANPVKGPINSFQHAAAHAVAPDVLNYFFGGPLIDEVCSKRNCGPIQLLVDRQNFSVLHRAALEGNIPAIDFLLNPSIFQKFSLDPNSREYFHGSTPCHVAARCNEPLTAIRSLTTAGADLNAFDNEGRTTFDILAEQNPMNAVSLADEYRDKLLLPSPGSTSFSHAFISGIGWKGEETAYHPDFSETDCACSPLLDLLLPQITSASDLFDPAIARTAEHSLFDMAVETCNLRLVHQMLGLHHETPPVSTVLNVVFCLEVFLSRLRREIQTYDVMLENVQNSSDASDGEDDEFPKPVPLHLQSKTKVSILGFLEIIDSLLNKGVDFEAAEHEDMAIRRIFNCYLEMTKFPRKLPSDVDAAASSLLFKIYSSPHVSDETIGRVLIGCSSGLVGPGKHRNLEKMFSTLLEIFPQFLQPRTKLIGTKGNLLHKACETRSHKAITAILSRCKEDLVNAIDSHGRTPLHVLLRQLFSEKQDIDDDVDFCKICLKGADMLLKDSVGESCLDILQKNWPDSFYTLHFVTVCDRDDESNTTIGNESSLDSSFGGMKRPLACSNDEWAPRKKAKTEL